MAQTKITSKSLAPLTVAAANIADDAIESRHISPTIFSPVLFSDKSNSSTGQFVLPVGTTAQRPLVANAYNGAVRVNSDFGYLEWYDSLTQTWLKFGDNRPPTLSYSSILGFTTTDITDSNDGLRYRVVSYKTPGTYTFGVTRSGAIDFLIVAGGGSGGNRHTTNGNGGGGAGGVLYKKNHVLSSGTHTVTIGDGGQPLAFQEYAVGKNGNNSSINDFVAIGGGGGGSTQYAELGSLSGGSSGGIAANANGPLGKALQVDYKGARGYGNVGGRYFSDWSGGGGGGAGSKGEDGYGIVATSNSGNGDGGHGIGFDITGTMTYYAGGGGGGGNSTEHAGDGWHGGGRGFGTTDTWSNTNYPLVIHPIKKGFGTPDAVPNTGGGGGAGSYWSDSAASANWTNRGSGRGGSGVVIIRYRIP